MSSITIAIDGYSSTGKSTLAKKLAKALNYVYVDTGAMYRSVTLAAMQAGAINNGKIDRTKLKSLLKSVEISFQLNEKTGNGDVILNGKNVEEEIRSLEVSKNVSNVAAISAVRKKLVEQQQQMGKGLGLVMDGRDIGTVVFPSAEVKFFLTASPEKRATRRYKELLDRGDNVKYADVLKNVQDRDYIDSHREDSPLKKANDAIEIDNSDMGLEEQLERMLSYTKDVIELQ
ncbi:(d)CMP kinase [Spongiivirga citrea]|uniref:Cytidylate kinase n=1 Tax=Spongiivirga citrea TaxID=1481457 RepID=A0A6M0CQA9_9FLAO|nr:(d)CMP kinase [Spongiivirga citrea]NER17687.1 (d)CMP kinase [Spongiivirga citrea]